MSSDKKSTRKKKKSKTPAMDLIRRAAKRRANRPKARFKNRKKTA